MPSLLAANHLLIGITLPYTARMGVDQEWVASLTFIDYNV